MNNEILWLIRLLTAHLITDFVLQPKSWVIARREKNLAAWEFWCHIGLTALVAAWFTGFDSWWVPFIILFSHGIIDWWKNHRKDNFLYFSIDQILHLTVIFFIWMFRFNEFVSPLLWIRNYKFTSQFWIIGMAIIILSTPIGIIIGMITKQFRDKIEDHAENSLENAGTWIGVLERLIIFFLVIVCQYEAIGLLIAAKSIIRLKEGQQKMSEYVLVGTLLSVSTAILIGYLVSKLI